MNFSAYSCYVTISEMGHAYQFAHLLQIHKAVIRIECEGAWSPTPGSNF